MTIKDKAEEMFLLSKDRYPPHLHSLTIQLLTDAFRQGYVMGGDTMMQIYQGRFSDAATRKGAAE